MVGVLKYQVSGKLVLVLNERKEFFMQITSELRVEFCDFEV